MKISVAVVEDERLSLSRIKKLLANFPDLLLVGSAENGNDALALIESEQPDLLLLDIKIPGMNGIQLLKQLHFVPRTLFLTAYDEYAVTAFELNAIDYILKPFTEERFNTAIQRGIEALSRKEPNIDRLVNFIDDYLGGTPRSKKYLERITIKVDYMYRTFPIEQIDLFGSDEEGLFMVAEGRRYPLDTPLSKLEEDLDPDTFFRARRNSLINIERIKKIDVWGRRHISLQFAGDETVHLSRDKISEFKQLMGFQH